MAIIKGTKGGETPALVVERKVFRRDLDPHVMEIARSSGIAYRHDNQNTERASQGIDIDNPLLDVIQAIKANTDIDIALKVLKLGFVSRVIQLTAGVPSQIIAKSKFPRGYIIINPAETTGFASTVTPFPSLLRAPATYNSAAFNVSGVDTARFFLDVTVLAAGGTLVVNAQTQDPLTLGWATSQTDIFSGSVAVATSPYYASIGPLGVDRQLRLQAVVGVNNVTFSVSGLFKSAVLTPTGSTIYIGDSNVTTLIGYPILAGQRESFWLWDNVELFAISPSEPVVLKIFQLQ